MNTDQREGEWEHLKRKIQAKWEEGAHRGLGVTSGSQKLIEGKLQKLFGMTREQAEKAVAILIEI
jgi:uncharacterized protein YjbJ (UPF0337 family)